MSTILQLAYSPDVPDYVYLDVLSTVFGHNSHDSNLILEGSKYVNEFGQSHPFPIGETSDELASEFIKKAEDYCSNKYNGTDILIVQGEYLINIGTPYEPNLVKPNNLKWLGASLLNDSVDNDNVPGSHNEENKSGCLTCLALITFTALTISYCLYQLLSSIVFI